MAIPTILKGDTPAVINLTLADGYDYSSCALEVSFCAQMKVFTGLQAGDTLHLEFSAKETSAFPLGTSRIYLTLRNSLGEKKSLPWAKIKVSDSPEEVYDAPIAIDPSQIDISDATDADSITAIKEKINAILQFLRGGVMVLIAALSLDLYALDANTQLNDIAGTTTIGEIVLAGGGGGGGDIPVKTFATKKDLENFLNKTNNVFSDSLYLSFPDDQTYLYVQGNIDTYNIYSGTLHVNYALYNYGETYLSNETYLNNKKLVDWLNRKTDRADVTNVVRDVLGTVYDEKLNISWKQVMYDGNLYYVAVTNANITEVSE